MDMNMNPGEALDVVLGEQLGTGTFGDVYSFIDQTTRKKYAIKIEKKESNLLRHEYKIYRYITRDNNPYFPKVYFYGSIYHKKELCNVMIMDCLGLSLQKVFLNKGKLINEETVFKIAISMISCVENLHNKHFIHRDIKPDNFAFGRGKFLKNIHLLDLGLAKKFRSASTYLHIPEKSGKSLIGTARYASINVHKGNEQSRRDDLESLGYCILFFSLGKLPWQGVKASTKEEKHKEILRIKETTPLRSLTAGLHESFYEYMKYVRSLDFKEMPDYEYLRSIFDNALYEIGGNVEDDIQLN